MYEHFKDGDLTCTVLTGHNILQILQMTQQKRISKFRYLELAESDLSIFFTFPVFPYFLNLDFNDNSIFQIRRKPLQLY